jgi:hypothetical protein
VAAPIHGDRPNAPTLRRDVAESESSGPQSSEGRRRSSAGQIRWSLPSLPHQASSHHLSPPIATVNQCGNCANLFPARKGVKKVGRHFQNVLSVARGQQCSHRPRELPLRRVRFGPGPRCEAPRPGS